jgi:hypothetical protein
MKSTAKAPPNPAGRNAAKLPDLGFGQQVQAAAERYAEERLDQILFLLERGARRDARPKLLKAIGCFARDTCPPEAIFGWAQYRDHLKRVVAAGEQFIASVEDRDPVSIQAGLQNFLHQVFPRSQARVVETRAVLVELKQAYALAQRLASGLPPGMAPLRSRHELIDALLAAVRLQWLGTGLPQKEIANADKFKAERYPLFVFSRQFFDLACKSAATAIDSLKLPARYTMHAKKRIRKPSNGTLVSDLRSGIARARTRLRRKLR